MRRLVARTAAIALTVVAACGGGDDTVESIADVREVLDDDGAYRTGRDAGAAFTRVAEGLLHLGRRCVAEEDAGHERCDRLLAAAAYAQVFAPDALTCTRPAIDEARAALDDYLEGATEVPAVPSCE